MQTNIIIMVQCEMGDLIFAGGWLLLGGGWELVDSD
jgi:hypothetical protein